MAYYISLVRFTDQGIRGVKDVPQRIANAERMFQQSGVKVSQIYPTMGRYDYVAVMEADSDEAATKAALALGQLGNVRTETLRAYGRDEVGPLVRARDRRRHPPGSVRGRAGGRGQAAAFVGARARR